MASQIEMKCPNCQQFQLTRIDNMLRCTCGWWFLAEGTIPIDSKKMKIKTVAAY
ncbi:MAG: hypothetical protein GF308_09690 [Candidatus Heimdallarchaeota archaeon]|nr:hypothetical protein [Candidatus Heimdallarchaeota archaeon]